MERKVVIFDHPLIQHKLSILRDANTSTKDFRELVNEIAMLMTYEATRDLPTEDIKVKTPCGVANCKHIAGRKMAFVPILRAGLGMVDGCLKLVPAARVGHIGLYRDETTHTPVEYYCKLPKDIEEREVFVVDPMLATGGSAIDAITQIKLEIRERLSLCALSPLRKDLRLLKRLIPMLIFIVPLSTTSLTRIATLSPASATQATEFSVQNNPFHNYSRLLNYMEEKQWQKNQNQK